MQTLAHFLSNWGTEVGGYFQLSIYCCNVNREALGSCCCIVSLQAHSWSSPAEHLGRKGATSLLFQSSSHLEKPSLFQVWKPRGKSTHLKSLHNWNKWTVFTPGAMLGFHFTASLLWIKKSSINWARTHSRAATPVHSRCLEEKTCGSTSLCNSTYYSCNKTFVVITCPSFCCQENAEANNATPVMLRSKHTGNAE